MPQTMFVEKLHRSPLGVPKELGRVPVLAHRGSSGNYSPGTSPVNRTGGESFRGVKRDPECPAASLLTRAVAPSGLAGNQYAGHGFLSQRKAAAFLYVVNQMGTKRRVHADRGCEALKRTAQKVRAIAPEYAEAAGYKPCQFCGV